MKIKQLEGFVATVELGSISKAAEMLYISQPSLSKLLKALEDEMGKELLIRKSKGVIATHTGRLFYRYAQSILSELQVLENMKKMNTIDIYTELRVSVYSLFLKEDLFVEFMKKQTSYEAVLNIDEVTIEQLVENVSTRKSEVGVAVVNDFELAVLQKIANSRRLNIDIIAEGDLYVHMGKCNKNYYNDTIFLKDFFDSTYLHFPFDTYSNPSFSMIIDDIPLKNFNKVITVNNYNVIINILKNMDSFLFGNRWQINQLEKMGIVSKKVSNCNVRNHLLIITDEKANSTQEAKEFIKNLKDRYL